VGAATPVTIQATYAGVTRTAELTVDPPAGLSSLAMNPASVVGGSPTQGTAVLTGAAPAGGAVVILSSGNAAIANVPASVTVLAGATSASFSVTTVAVGASVAVTISASYSGVTRTLSLNVTPQDSGPLPAPTLLSPATDARFSPGRAISFDWSDVASAASYSIEIDDADTFAEPLVLRGSATSSGFSTSTLPTRRMWWRVRAISASGQPGAVSTSRRFEVK
jgi:hypothetical protein